MSWLDRGWQVFAPDNGVLDWLKTAAPAAIVASRDHQARSEWLRCEGTWFVGVDTLPNDHNGKIGDSGPLDCAALDAAQAVSGILPLHKGQVSATYPGYPKRGKEESEGAYKFRRVRDAAHVDGMKPAGKARRRFLDEPHAWILGLPVTECGQGASPLVVWEESHEIIRHRLSAILQQHQPEKWGSIDMTETYQAARREVFETCRRVELPGMPGEAHLIHRLAVHGMAPWIDSSVAPEEGRVVVYFRPHLAQISDWLKLP